MNWIGGSLARHSKLPSTTTKRRQHKHRVPVRSQQKLGQQSPLSPFRSNFIRVDFNAKDKYTDSAKSNKRQKTLEEYPEAALLVHHLKSMTTSRRSDELSKHSQSPAKCQTRNSSSLTSCFEITKPKLLSIANSKEGNIEKQEMSRFENDYNNTAMQSKTTEIEQKMLHMLDQPDWAGLRYTRPVHINFTKRKKEVIKRPRDAAQRELPVQKAINIRHHGRPEDAKEHRSDVAMTGVSSRVPIIQIRIGTDALQSTRPYKSDDTISSVIKLNDDMLFDSFEDMGVGRATSKSPDQKPNRKRTGAYEKDGLSTSSAPIPPDPNYRSAEGNSLASIGLHFISRPDPSIYPSPELKLRSAQGNAAHMSSPPGPTTTKALEKLPDRLADLDCIKACDYELQSAEAEFEGYPSAFPASVESLVEHRLPRPIPGCNLLPSPINSPDLREIQPSAHKPMTVSREQEEEDKIWRRFVFGKVGRSESDYLEGRK
jgi:hypothetical protein